MKCFLKRVGDSFAELSIKMGQLHQVLNILLAVIFEIAIFRCGFGSDLYQISSKIKLSSMIKI